MARVRPTTAILLAALLLAAQGPAAAQPALAPGQVSGAELQAWFDADGMAIAGVNTRNQCYFMARGVGDRRRQFIDCPAMPPPFMVVGEAKVVGHQLCSKFTYPDGTGVDRCQDIFKVGDNRYEIRHDGQVVSVIQRLLR